MTVFTKLRIVIRNDKKTSIRTKRRKQLKATDGSIIAFIYHTRLTLFSISKI